MSGSSRFAVAVHCLAVLAYLERRGISPVSSRQIAQSVNTNAVVIRNLLRILKKAGLVRSKEGKGGGVRLARPAARISLQQIRAAVEPESVLGHNHRPRFKECPVSSGMKEAFRSVANDVDGAVAQVLGRRTLKSVVDRL